MPDPPAEAGRRDLVTVAWLAVATVLGWSVFDHLPYADLDRSWVLGLNLMHLDGMHFGDDVVFNYGPLGFIARPVAGTGILFPLALSGVLALTVLAAWSVHSSLRTIAVPDSLVGPVTAVVMLVAPFENLLVETTTVLGVVWLVLRRRTVGPVSPAVISACGALIAVVGLIKVSMFVPTVIAVAIIAATSGWRAWWAGVFTFSAAFCGLWVTTGQRLADVPSWVSGSRQIAQGHVSAMNLDDPSRRWEYLAVALLLCAGVALVMDRRSIDRALIERRAAAVVSVLVALIIGWFVVRQGFTRHGARTRLVFFTLAWILGTLAPWGRLSVERRRGVIGVIAVSVIAFVVAAGSLGRLANPVTPVGDAIESARLVISSGYRTERVEQARADARSSYDVPDSMIGLIGERAVLVDPNEIVAAWAYELRWVPFASMQRYLSYTEWLDERNGALLRDDGAPAFVLHQRNATIDGRYEPADGPSFVTELFCSYELVESSDRWDLLERSTDRCGPPELIGTMTMQPGDRVPIPTAGNDAVLMAVTFDARTVDTVAELLLKPIRNPHVELGDRRFRMLPATSPTPALISVPGEPVWSDGFGFVPAAETLTVESRATVSFYSMSTGI